MLLRIWKIGVFVPEMSEPDFYALSDGNGWRESDNPTHLIWFKTFTPQVSPLSDAAATKPEPRFQNPALNSCNCSVTCTENSSAQIQPTLKAAQKSRLFPRCLHSNHSH